MFTCHIFDNFLNKSKLPHSIFSTKFIEKKSGYRMINITTIEVTSICAEILFDKENV